MSNNIYDILKKMQGLEAPKQTLTEGKKAKPDYIDIDKDGNKTEPMKKAVKDKAKGSMAEAVAQVERQLNEKYMGFKKTVAAIKKGSSAENPEAVAAAIGRKKYGKAKFQKAAAAGKKLGEASGGKPDPKEFEKDLEWISQGHGYQDKEGTFYDRAGNPSLNLEKTKRMEKNRTYPDYRHPGVGDGMPDRPVQEDEIEESGLQAYLGKKKYGKEGMQALQKAGREGASKEKMAKIRAQHDKMDEDNTGTVPPKHYGGDAAFDLYMQQRKEELAKQKPKNEDEASQTKQDPYGQYQKNLKPGKTIGSKIATGAKNIKRKAEKYVANKLGHNLERGPLDEQNYTEDMLSPAQKKFAALAEPKDKITYADKIAGAKKKQKDEGNEFSGELVKARAQGKDSFEVDGKSYPVKEDDGDFTGDIDDRGNLQLSPAGAAKVQKHPKYDPNRSANAQYSDHFDQRGFQRMTHDQAVEVGKHPEYNPNLPANAQHHLLNKSGNMQAMKEGRTSMREGWEEMQKYLEKKRGPESKGGEGKKAGTRYGGSAQKDDDEELDGEGQPAVKKKGRPKGTGGGAKFSFKKAKD